MAEQNPFLALGAHPVSGIVLLLAAPALIQPRYKSLANTEGWSWQNEDKTYSFLWAFSGASRKVGRRIWSTPSPMGAQKGPGGGHSVVPSEEDRLSASSFL